MTAPAPVSTYKSFCGIAKEATKGTAVAATAYIPLLEPADFQPRIKYMPDVSNRASMAANTGMIAGVTSTDYSIKGNVFPDTVGWILAGVMGEVATTGASAPYSHSITLLNSGHGQPTAYTITDNYQAACRQIPGLQWDEFGLTFAADGLLEYTAHGMGYPSAALSAPTPSFSSITPLPGWIGTCSVGGSSVTTLLSADVSVKRAVNPEYTAQNSQSPAFVWGGEVDITGTLTFVMESDSGILTPALTNTQPAVVLDFQQGTSGALVELKLTMTKCAFGEPKIDRGSPYVKVQVPFTAVGNTTDVGSSGGYGPGVFLLKNAIAASVYV